MSTTYPVARELDAAAAIDTTPARAATGSISLAELLAEVGMAIDALPSSQVNEVSPRIAVVTANLVDGAHEAGADGGLFTPSRETTSTVSLRALGRLATRTAGREVQLAPARAQQIRDLIAELAA